MKQLLPILIAVAVLSFVFFFTRDPGQEGNGGGALAGSDQQHELVNSQGADDPTVLDAGSGATAGGTANQTGAGVAAARTRKATGIALGDATVEGMLEVFVLHPLGGNPIKGATVRLLDRASLGRGVWHEAKQSTSGKRDLMDVQAQAFETTEQGVAVLPRIMDGVIHASGDGYEGWLEWIGPLSSPLEIPLKAAIDLQVLVVDSDGQPIPNCPVALCLNDPLNPRALDQTSSISPSGIANFRRVGATIGERNDETGFAVKLALPLVDTQLVAFNHKNLPREPLRLTMPSVGRLLVHVVDKEGEQVKSADVTLGRMIRDQKTGEMAFQGEVFRRRSAGFALFPNVPVGAIAVVKVSGTGDKRDLIQEVGAPLHSGENKDVTVVWDTTWPVIHARAVGPGGSPLANRIGRARMTEDGVARGGAPLNTDEQGYFDLPINRDWTLGTHRTAELELFSADGMPPGSANLDLSYNPPEGVTKYGDVGFQSLPKLASGLVFADGVPVAGVQVRIMERVQTKVGEEWVPLGSMVASSRADGTFEIYGEEIPTGPNAVMARRRGYQRAYQTNLHLPTGGLRLNLVEGEEDPTSLAGKGRARGGPDGRGGAAPRGATRPPGGFPVGTTGSKAGRDPNRGGKGGR